MFRGKLTLGIAIAALISSAIMVPAKAAVTSELLNDCGVASTTLCIESFELSLDDGATWSKLSAIPGGPRANLHTPYSFAGTGYVSPVDGIDALAVNITRIEVRQDAQTPYTSSNGIQTVVIAADLDTWNQPVVPRPAMDPRASFRLTLRIGDLSPTYTVGMMTGIKVDVTRSPEFNKIVIQGKPVELPHLRNQTREICAGPIAIAEETVYQFQSMTFDMIGQPTVWSDVNVAYDGSCGYELNFTGVEGSQFPGLYMTAFGPHFYPDGQTQNIGRVEAVLPATFLSERLGLTQDSALAGGLMASTRYTPGVDSPVNFTVTPEPNGAVRVVADGFHFSAPTVVVKRAKAGTPIQKQIDAALPFNTKRTSAQVAQIFGMNPPAKSKISITVAKASTKSKICKIAGGKLVTLKATGACTATVKIQPPKPGPVSASGNVNFSAGQKMSGAAIASALGMSVPATSKVSVSINKVSRKACTSSSGGIKAKSAATCSVKVKVQAPQPPAYSQISTIAVR